MTPPTKLNGIRRNAKICERAPPKRDHPRIVESLCCKLLLYQKERWEVVSSPRLLSNQQMDEEKPKRVSPDPTNHQLA
jgi:hypothetical protein